MSTTYAPKQSPAQKKDANTAASVVDSSSQAQSLQRKADLCNSPIQCYGMSRGFQLNHSYCTRNEAIERCLRRRQVNSVLTQNAQNILRNTDDANVTRIIGVNCATWQYNGGVPYKIPGPNYCAVVINGRNMDHLESSGTSTAAAHMPNGWINFSQLRARAR